MIDSKTSESSAWLMSQTTLPIVDLTPVDGVDIASAPNPVGRCLSGRYLLQDEIGRGGVGVVFKAIDTEADVPRAVKVLRPGLADPEHHARRLAREAVIGMFLDHPHIVPTTDAGVEGPYVYLVMPWMPGGSAHERLVDGGALAGWEAAHIGLQVLSALEFSHAGGILHRDVKPANILFDAEGQARLADFGIAVFPDADVVHTDERAVLGSTSYMPPEQRVASNRVTTASDLYALATTLVQLMAPGNPSDLYLDPPDAGRWVFVPRRYRGILRKAVSLDPADRPADAAHFARGLYRALQQDPMASAELLRSLGGGPLG